MNKCFLIGNLTQEPNASTFDSGHTVCRFTIAVNRISRNSENNSTDFINIVAWDGLAQNCVKYLTKGSKVAVVGSIQTGSYEKDGIKRQTVDVRADQVEFLNRASGNTAPSQGQQASPNSRPSIDSLQEIDDNDDDMPF